MRKSRSKCGKTFYKRPEKIDAGNFGGERKGGVCGGGGGRRWVVGGREGKKVRREDGDSLKCARNPCRQEARTEGR